jgi:hypothetical protein
MYIPYKLCHYYAILNRILSKLRHYKVDEQPHFITMNSHDVTVFDTSAYPISYSTHGDTYTSIHTENNKP